MNSHYPWHRSYQAYRVKNEQLPQKMTGETHLEYFWGGYCVSTNYSNATLRVHDRGLAWKQIDLGIFTHT